MSIDDHNNSNKHRDQSAVICAGCSNPVSVKSPQSASWAREAWSGRHPRQKYSPKWLYLWDF